MPENSHPQSQKLTELIGKLREERAIDFRGYKLTSIGRRVQRRLDATKCEDIDAYLRLLEQQPEEYSKLLDALLINVTEFFREPEAWEIIRNVVIPQILAVKKKGDRIKIWSAGCATGEEPYTLAIVLSEVLGARVRDFDARIYATDIDEEALTVARRGEYTSDSLRHVPEHLRDKYFAKNDTWMVNRDIRKMIIFGRHNLVTDPPISHCDLIVCRNVLIYMGVPLQNQVLTRFHHVLESSGFLFLGKAEAMLKMSRLFSGVDDRARIFGKESPGGVATQELVEQRAMGLSVDYGTAEEQLINLFNDAVLRQAPIGVMAIDGSDIVRLMNPAAERIWGLRAREILGNPLVGEGLPLSLQNLAQTAVQVRHDRREHTVEELCISPERGREIYATVKVTPMLDIRGNAGGVIILAEDITTQVVLRQDLEGTNEELHATNEELETAYEELQSTNEELVTTNEELQSTNEELETTNEELQSTNEELETTNDELEARTAELSKLKEELEKQNAELENLNKSLNVEITERKRTEDDRRQMYDREHRISETLQRALLPPVPDRADGFALAVKYQPAWDESEVCGDFYLSTRTARDRLVLALGDVTGKGLEAAAFSAMAKHMILAFIPEEPAPEMMLARLDEALVSYGDTFRMITLVYLLIDLKSGMVHYANAGHEPPVFFSQATGEATLLQPTGAILGMQAGTEYGALEVPMGLGDILIAYTDGVSDAGHDPDAFGPAGVARVVRDCASRPGPEILDSLYQTAIGIAGGRLPDDATSILIKRER